MPRRVPPPLSVTLAWLRAAAAWPQKDLANAAHVHPNHLSDYEKGLRPLSRKRLEQLAHIMGYDDSAIDLALLAVQAISPPKESEDDEEQLRAFDRLSPAEKRLAKQSATRVGLVVADLAEARLLEKARARRVAAARDRAGQLWERFRKYSVSSRRMLVERSQAYRLWAFSERLAEESGRAAAKNARNAIELSRMAVRVAELTMDDGASRRRIEGLARGFLGNGLRVDGALHVSDAEFCRAWDCWRQGAAGDPGGVLQEWRLLDLEASLRRDKRQFPQALALLERARELAPREASGQILLKRASTLEQAGEFASAVDTLREATPLVEEFGGMRLRWVLRFLLAVQLCHLGHFDEAAKKLPSLREHAQRLGYELDVVRVLWLSGRVAEGQGRRREAIAAFEQARAEFESRRDAPDAALVSLELGLLRSERHSNQENGVATSESTGMAQHRRPARQQ